VEAARARRRRKSVFTGEEEEEEAQQMWLASSLSRSQFLCVRNKRGRGGRAVARCERSKNYCVTTVLDSYTTAGESHT
jgi:hypothetical protein